MKRIKLNLTLLAVVFAASAALAFKAPEKAKTFSPLWQYDGTGSTTDPSNYVEVTTPDCPTGSANICAIMAPESPSNPDQPQISTPLANRITGKNTSNGDVFLKH
jgi:hypothetical protein